MKITVHKDRLRKALGFVEHITARNTTLPILSNILLQTENGRLRISATNLEVGISSILGAKVESEGKIAVPTRTFSDFIKNAPGETVTLQLKQNNLLVQAGEYRTTILCFNASEYPIIPKIEEGKTYILQTETLKRLIRTVSDSVSLSDSRPELAGALVCFTNSATIMAATDIFRLAEHKEKSQHTDAGTIIIPRGVLTELGRILGDISGAITIRVADNQIAFNHEEFTIISRVIDGKYPDYKKVIPGQSISRVLVRKDELENAVKVAALFSSSISDIRLDCDGKKLQVSGKNSGKGEAQAGIEANVKGEGFSVAMNYRYFLDGLKVIQTEKVILEYTGKGSPFMLRPNTEEKDTTYLIMPLRN